MLFAVRKYPASTFGPLALTASPGNQAQLLSVTVAFGAAVAGQLVIVWHHNEGPVYSTELARLGMGYAIITRDIFWQPESRCIIDEGDSIEVTYANAGGVSVNAVIAMEVSASRVAW